MCLIVLPPLSLPKYLRQFTGKNIKIGKTEKTFYWGEKDKHNCAQKESVGAGRINLGKIGFHGGSQIKLNYEHHNSLESFIKYRFLGLTLRGCKVDRSYQLFQYPSQSYEEINSFFSLWLVSKGSLESKVLGSPRIPAGRPELQLGLRKNSIWGLTCLQNLAHRSSAPLSGCWCHCLPLQTTFIYIIGPVATKHLPRFILHRFCLYF